MAASNGNLFEIQNLVNNGVDVNSIDYDKRTACHIAAANGRTETLQLLHEKLNAEINIKDRWGHTCLYDAILNRRQKAIDLLLSYGGTIDLNVLFN
jgi:glutaminase